MDYLLKYVTAPTQQPTVKNRVLRQIGFEKRGIKIGVLIWFLQGVQLEPVTRLRKIEPNTQ